VQRRGRAGQGTGHPEHEVDVHGAAVRQSVAVDETLQGPEMADLEDLELRHDLALLGRNVELGHEGHRVVEDVVTEIDGAARQ
jgi:hypothetical protein